MRLHTVPHSTYQKKKTTVIPTTVALQHIIWTITLNTLHYCSMFITKILHYAAKCSIFAEANSMENVEKGKNCGKCTFCQVCVTDKMSWYL